MMSVPWQWGQCRTCIIMLSLGWLEGCSASHTPRENSRPTPLKHPLAAIAHVKGDDLACLDVHSDPHPLLVGFFLHEAGQFIGFHFKSLDHNIAGTGDGLDVEMIRQGLEALDQ